MENRIDSPFIYRHYRNGRLVTQVEIPPTRVPTRGIIHRVVQRGIEYNIAGGTVRFIPVNNFQHREDWNNTEKLAKVDKSSVDKELSCPICLCNFNETEDNNLICVLKCQHIIHEICIKKWLDTANKNECPLCRREAV